MMVPTVVDNFVPKSKSRARFTRFYEVSVIRLLYEKEIAFHGAFFYDRSSEVISTF